MTEAQDAIIAASLKQLKLPAIAREDRRLAADAVVSGAGMQCSGRRR